MANPNSRADVIIKILADRIGELALVYEGWPSNKHVEDLRRTRGLSENMDVSEVSITEFDHWPGHLDVNVWAQSRRERDEVSHMVIDTLNQIKKEHKMGIREIRTHDITFEEKGSIRPGKWDISKGSKPIFRKLIQVSLGTGV
jgi:hypothetical protein